MGLPEDWKTYYIVSSSLKDQYLQNKDWTVIVGPKNDSNLEGSKWMTFRYDTNVWAIANPAAWSLLFIGLDKPYEYKDGATLAAGSFVDNNWSLKEHLTNPNAFRLYCVDADYDSNFILTAGNGDGDKSYLKQEAAPNQYFTFIEAPEPSEPIPEDAREKIKARFAKHQEKKSSGPSSAQA